MICVAIFNSPVGNDEAPGRLGAVLGCTAYEARARLVVEGPCVVATFTAESDARHLADALNRAGFRSLVRDLERVERPEAWFPVRSLAFGGGGPEGPSTLTLSGRQGAARALALDQVAFVIHGVAVASQESAVVETRKKFSAARAGLTAGVAARKKVKREVVERSEQREMFLHLYVPGHPVYVVGETSVEYSGWEGHRSAGRAQSFQMAAKVLSRHSGVRYDRRLLSRLGQKQLLGPRLSEETHIRLCSALVVGALAQSG